MKDCTTCKYGYEDERLGIPMCHHPKRFSEDCVDFNMHEEKEIKESEEPVQNDLEEAAKDFVWEVMENDEDGISDLCKKLRPTSKISDFYDALAEFFIAGAKWQKAQDDKLVDTIYQQGIEKGKDDMKEEFEKSRLAACDKMTEEEYDRESAFALEIIDKEHRMPTFSDAINYGMKLQKEQNKPKPTEDLVDYAYRRYPICNRRIGTTKDANEDLRDGFLEGVDWQKEQMMKEAVEGTYNNSDWGTPCVDLPSPLELERFDKVRVIIVKEEEK